MNKFVKRIIACFLSIIMLFSAIPLNSFAEKKSAVPLVYVSGQGAHISKINEDGSREEIYPIKLPEDYIENVVKENIDCFAKAVVTQQWDEFCDVLYGAVSPLFSDLKLDEKGNPIVKSQLNWNWERGNPKMETMDNPYGIPRYEFYYDWRLDPYVCADSLHDYIEDVLAVTGAEKVALLGRCLGACVISAYMEKYDGEYVSDLIYYASALNGATQVSKSFCGELYIDADGVERYLYDLDLFPDDNINELLRAFVSLYNTTYGLEIACWSVNNVYEKIYLDIMPRLMIDTFGTFPGFWSMVSDEDYNKAKETVFMGGNMEKYADLIDIIDNYHYNIQVKSAEHLLSYAERGIEVSNIVKYGYQTVPITENADILSDDVCDVRSASMGAYTSDVGKSFSRMYLRKSVELGTYKYISPDFQIDASTCLFPERTWFIKNLEHKNFPDVVNNLFYEIIYNDKYTVFSDPDYPQYLVYDNGDGVDKLHPMTVENKNTDKKYKISFLRALSKFFKALFNIVKKAITKQVIG